MWMELEDIMLSELSQPKKDNYHRFYSYAEFKKQNRGSLWEGREK